MHLRYLLLKVVAFKTFTIINKKSERIGGSAMHWTRPLSVVALRRFLFSSFGMVAFCVGCGVGRINMFRQANCPVLYACTGRREPVASDGSMWSFTYRELGWGLLSAPLLKYQTGPAPNSRTSLFQHTPNLQKPGKRC